VLADVTRILADRDISIEALLQKEPAPGASDVPIILLTYEVREQRMNDAIAAIEAPAEQLAHLEGLLVDRRGNRAGFPQDVQYELEALYDFLYRRTHLPAR